MKTRIGFRQVHENSPAVIVMDGRVPLNKIADRLRHHFMQQAASSATVKVTIGATGREAGRVLVTLGPFAIEGIVVYEGQRPPTEDDMGA